MENELSIVKLVLEASPVVQVVMGLLLLASLMSWTIIFRKRSLLSKALCITPPFRGLRPINGFRMKS